MNENKTNANSNRPSAPFALNHAEAQAEIFGAINNARYKYQLPYFMIEPILLLATTQIQQAAKDEIASEEIAYQQQLKEWESSLSPQDDSDTK